MLDLGFDGASSETAAATVSCERRKRKKPYRLDRPGMVRIERAIRGLKRRAMLKHRRGKRTKCLRCMARERVGRPMGEVFGRMVGGC